jgi:hypothetical protein
MDSSSLSTTSNKESFLGVQSSGNFFISRKHDISMCRSSIPAEAWTFYKRDKGLLPADKMARDNLNEMLMDFFITIPSAKNFHFGISVVLWKQALIRIMEMCSESMCVTDLPDDPSSPMYIEREFFEKNFLTWVGPAINIQHDVRYQAMMKKRRKKNQNANANANTNANHDSSSTNSPNKNIQPSKSDAPTDVHANSSPFEEAVTLISLSICEYAIGVFFKQTQSVRLSKFRIATLTAGRDRKKEDIDMIWAFIQDAPLFKKFKLSTKDKLAICRMITLQEVKAVCILLLLLLCCCCCCLCILTVVFDSCLFLVLCFICT